MLLDIPRCIESNSYEEEIMVDLATFVLTCRLKGRNTSARLPVKQDWGNPNTRIQTLKMAGEN